MPGREIPLITNQIYHIFNRGISFQPTFEKKKELNRAIELIRYYQNKKPPLKYSQFIILSLERRSRLLAELTEKKEFLVEMICFCIMPNHFHFIVKQIEDDGISKFVSQFTNSYTRYFNVKNKRRGPLFQGKFKAIRIETDEQLLHLSRYIHLNPYTSYIVRNFNELADYQYSSLPEYLGKAKFNFCSKEIILSHFRYPKLYYKFITDQADYQRKLGRIKHLTFEAGVMKKIPKVS